MDTYSNYEDLRHAFIEGEITRHDFEAAAKKFDGHTMLRVELKHAPWWHRLFNFRARALSRPSLR